MKFAFVKYLVLFLILNFLALAIGSMATTEAVGGQWYQGISKAPWTPPGWVFGAVWTSVMFFFAFFMAFAIQTVNNKKRLIGLYVFQWVLNVSWNPVFFVLHQTLAALFIIVILTLLVAYLMIEYRKILKMKTLLILPYFIWLLIATSLNAYVVIYN